MDLQVAKETIRVIREEAKRRADRLNGVDGDVAYDVWTFDIQPFINDLCLMLLVALRHQVERELVRYAARSKCGPTLTGEEFSHRVREWESKIGSNEGWKSLNAALHLNSHAEHRAMQTLRLLTNCFKHAATLKPDHKLLDHLKLPRKPLEPNIVGYAPLAESTRFQEALAESIGLPTKADYCTIADGFIDQAAGLLEKVSKYDLAKVKGGRASLIEFVY